MTIELKLLVWSTALALIQMLIAVVAAMAQVGLIPFVGNRENLPAFEGWAGRAQRAHRNMLESLTKPAKPPPMAGRKKEVLQLRE